MKLKKTNSRYIILFFIILIIQTTLIFFYLRNKAGLATDEIYTFSLSNSSNGMYFFPNIFNKAPAFNFEKQWIDGAVFNAYLCTDENNKFNYSNVRDNQVQDTHPPFYYYLIHTICSTYPDSFSKWYGLGLNLFLFICSQLMLFRLSLTILESKKYAFLVCVFYGFSLAAADNIAYISVNSLLTFINLILVNLLIKCLNNKFSLFLFVELMLLVLVGGLTHYTFILYVFILVSTFAVITIVNKNRKQAFSVFITTMLGVLCIYLIFPEIINQLLYSIYVQEVLIGIDNLIPNIGAFSHLIRKFLGIPFPFYFYLGIVLFIGCCGWIALYVINKYYKNQAKEKLCLSVIPAFITIILISLGINYNSTDVNPLKYFFCFFPFIAVFLIAVLKELKYSKIIVSLLILLSVVPFGEKYYSRFETQNLYKSMEDTVIGSRIILCVPIYRNLQSYVQYLALSEKAFIIRYGEDEIVDLSSIPLSDSKKTYLVAIGDCKLKAFGYSHLLSNNTSLDRVNIYEHRVIK